MKLRSYAEVQNHFNKILNDNQQMDDTVNISPHGAWWNTMTYEEFVTGNVPNVNDPNTGKPMPTLVIGNSGQSNLIFALRGTPGTVFDPNTGSIRQMPADGPPFFTAEQIQPLADWIDDGCPNDI